MPRFLGARLAIRVGDDMKFELRLLILWRFALYAVVTFSHPQMSDDKDRHLQKTRGKCRINSWC